MKNTSKIAIILKEEHLENPIQASLEIEAEKRGWDIVDLSDAKKCGKYDLTILYHNKPIHTSGKKRFWWMCDLRPDYLFPKHNFDHIFLCNKEHIKGYEKRFNCDVSFLSQCGDDREMPMSGRIIAKDLVFIGNFSSNYHINRYPIIFQLEDLGVSVSSISGEGYSKDTKYIYKNAPFCLAMSPQAKGYTSNRLYNILSSGGFCISLWYPEIDKQFTKGKHLEWFKKPSEVPKILEYYYKNPEEYEKVKKEGKKLYERKHTASKKLDFMLKYT